MTNLAKIEKPQQTLMAALATKYQVPEKEMLESLKATAFKSDKEITNAQMNALLIVANQYNLNPWTKEIYAFPHKGGIVPIVGVDGWARIINENMAFDGMDFIQDEESCTCRMYRKDRSHPIAVTEYLSECKKPTDPWKSHPKRMLRHKAMIQCARVAFAYTGIFDEDEAERIVEKDITPQAERPAVSMPKTKQQAETAEQPEKPIEGEMVPRGPEQTKQSQTASENQLTEIRKRAQIAGVTEEELCGEFFLETLEQLPQSRVLDASKFLRSKAGA